MEKLALAIIAKDEVEKLNEIIKRYQEYFDEIVILADTEMSFDCDKVKVFSYVWQDDFAHKRNTLADLIESPYYFRMDTDDEIYQPEKIREVFGKVVKNGVDVVYFEYLYGSDEDNNVNVSHWRETIIRRTKDFYWKMPVHETLHIEDLSRFHGIRDHRVKIIHKVEKGHTEKSAQRNFKILLKEFERDQENCDLRTISYIGRMLLGWGHYEKAKYFLELLVNKSGYDDDKYFGWIHLGNCHRFMGKPDTAIACCNEALAINTEFPDAYLSLMEIYLEKKDYKKAIHWGKIGVVKPKPNTMFVIDNTNYTYRPLVNLAVAHFGLGDFEAAKVLIDRAKELAPSNEFIKSNYQMFCDGYEADKYYKNLMWMLMYLRENDDRKIVPLVDSIPKKLLKDERLQALRHKFLPPKRWNKDSLVILCGNSPDEWAAPSTITGIGGSEEAVIYISQELTKLGYDVTVFNNCGDMAGTYSDVTYRPFFEFNPNDEYNAVIAWRHDVFNGRIKAKKKIVWLHDVPQKDTLNKECDFDYVLVLSEFHKTLLPGFVPEEKIVVSANGINLKDFNLPEVERQPHRMIYTSSYDRGIQHLLLMWEDIRKEVPDAELHLFYGWNTYDKFMEMGHRPREFREQMTQLMNQPGVFEHGRIGHKKLNKEFMKSKFWVYPSHFEEISCISAMKAQACGCVPVVINYAALKETVKDGVRVEGKGGGTSTNFEYKNALIKALKEQPTVNIDKEQFGWDKVAKQWKEKCLG